MEGNHAQVDYAHVHEAAVQAADAAVEGMQDVGYCGYGYVRISPGTHGFARWLRKNADARTVNTGLWRGTHLSSRTGQQAYETNRVWVEKYADIVNRNYSDLSAIGLVRAD